MLLKIRFHLEGEAPPDPYQHARGLRALVLNWIGEVDPDYSKEIHDANQPKPYSIGSLRQQEHLRRACWFDLTVLVDALYAPILQGQQQQGKTFRLGQYSYRIREVEILRPMTYEEIIRAAPKTAREFRFRQATPTAHHRGSEIRKAIVLPDPELYFGNWWMRWNLCSEWQIGRELLDVVERQVAVTWRYAAREYRQRTEFCRVLWGCHVRAAQARHGSVRNATGVGRTGNVCGILRNRRRYDAGHGRNLAARHSLRQRRRRYGGAERRRRRYCSEH